MDGTSNTITDGRRIRRSGCVAMKDLGSVSFVCTRVRGHKGRHEAKGLNGVVLHRWAAKA